MESSEVYNLLLSLFNIMVLSSIYLYLDFRFVAHCLIITNH